MMSKGYTLIETIMAIGVLTMLLAIVTATYARFSDLQRVGIGQQEMQEDIRLFLQLFSREARTAFGTTYEEIVNPPGVVFRNQEGRCVLYAYEADKHAITRAEAALAASSCADPGIYTGAARQLTDSENTIVQSLKFDASPALKDANPDSTLLTQQGFVTVHLTLHSAAQAAEEMQLQTTITSRQIVPYVP